MRKENLVMLKPYVDRLPEDYEISLHRAFANKKVSYIVIDSRRQEFQINSAEYGVEKGWLSKDEVTDGQCTEWRYRLTEQGKQYFLDVK
jgi:hypothetical protein